MKIVSFNTNLQMGDLIAADAYGDLPNVPIAQRVHYNGAMVQNGRLQITHEDNTPDGGMNLTVYAKGYGSWSGRYLLKDGANEAYNPETGAPLSVVLEPSATPFPRPGSNRDPLPPKEANDPLAGDVYDMFPPEFLALRGAEPQFADLDLIRGDAFTYMTPFAPSDVNPACATAWLQAIGQNTNFGEKMWYTPLLPAYPSDVQVAFFADYYKYNTHVLLDGIQFTADQVRASAALARAAGIEFVVVFSDNAQMLIDLAADHTIDFAIIGLEIDKLLGAGGIAAGDLDQLIATVCAKCVPLGVRVGLHFTSTGGVPIVQHWAFPVPGTDYVPWWAENQRLGVTHLFYESFMDYQGNMDSAGKMGAMMFYARKGLQEASRMNPGMPPLLLCAAEIMSAPPFMGLVDGPFSWRRATEMLCCPNTGWPDMPGVAGSFNGARKWDGSVV